MARQTRGQNTVFTGRRWTGVPGSGRVRPPAPKSCSLRFRLLGRDRAAPTCPGPSPWPAALPGAGCPSEARLACSPKEAPKLDLELSAGTPQGERGRRRRHRCQPDCLPPPPRPSPQEQFMDKGRCVLLTQEVRVPRLSSRRRGAGSQEPRGKESGREEPGPTTWRLDGCSRHRGAPPASLD